MSEVKDPAIKLFGKTIPLLPKQQVSVYTSPNKNNCDADEQEDGKKSSESEVTAATREEEEDYSRQAFEGLKDQETSCGYPKTQSVEEELNSPKPSKDEDQSETSLPQEMTLKKPDKILPCPRCSSMETKFCYYNNYNVNQPRHFCRKCQRYWTAGGTIRNVPVGSGRRKNKSAYALHSRHIMVSEWLQAARANGTVLSFGADAQPRCESTAPALNPVEKTVKISVSCGGTGENGDDDTRTSDSSEKRGNRNPVLQESVAKKFPCFAGRPWFFPWNSPEWRPAIPPPALLGLSGFPAPPSWGCALSRSWFPSPPCSTLGKHSRDESEKEEAMKEANSDRGGVWIPKTLRIDDLNEAEKSSIWSTLGFKNEKNDARGLFAAFQSGGDERTDETSLLLQANPAALSRSFNFRETV